VIYDLLVSKNGENGAELRRDAPAPAGTIDLCKPCARKRGMNAERAGSWLAMHSTVVCDDCGTTAYHEAIGNYDAPEAVPPFSVQRRTPNAGGEND
jgi:hypothetical protein